MLNSKEEAFPSEASINSHPQTPAGAHPHAHRATPAGEVPHAMPAGAKPAAGMSHSASMMQTMKNMSKDDIPPSMSEALKDMPVEAMPPAMVASLKSMGLLKSEEDKPEAEKAEAADTESSKPEPAKAEAAPARPHPHSSRPPMSGTFDAGVRAMKTQMADADSVRAFYANTGDPLHRAFTAKVAVHSGPGGMPLLGDAAQAKLEELSYQKRSGKSLAYIHVPFCETRCLYCLFYQNPYEEEQSRRFADTLIKELELWHGRAAQDSSPIHALYFGGGTPSALAPADILRILSAIKKYLPLANDCEITFESRIHNFNDEKIEAALAGGVNRFSLGVQSFNTEVRQMQRRVDDRDTILKRLEKLMSYNEAAVVIDLIYGFPKQTMEVWKEDLAMASSLPLDGVDCYQLNVFEKAPMAKFINNGKMPPPADTSMKADMFQVSVEHFTNANWRRLSNNHWGQGTRERNIYNQLGKSATDCLAFGSGAGGRLFGHSFMLQRKLDDWHQDVARGIKPINMLMTPGPNWFLLRTVSSEMESGAINLKQIEKRFNLPLFELAEPLLAQWVYAGLLVRRGDWFYQTVAGQYWHVTMAQLLVTFLESQITQASA